MRAKVTAKPLTNMLTLQSKALKCCKWLGSFGSNKLLPEVLESTGINPFGSLILFHTICTNLGCNPGLADERAYRLPLVGDVGAPLPSCPSSNCGSCSRPPPLMGWIGRVRFGGVLQMHPTASSGAPREPQLVVLLGLRASRSWSRSCSLLPLSAWSSASSSASVADLCLRPPCVFSLRLPFL